MNRKQLLLAACLLAAHGVMAAPQGNGYIPAGQAPNIVDIIPPPPAYGSVQFLNDKEIYESRKVTHSAQRMVLAAQDGDYKKIAAQFSPAFGREISAEKMPVLYSIIQRVIIDSHDKALRSAKYHYMRKRPFVFFEQSSCVPRFDERMRVTGSYPSGHATLGWAVALLLSEINPSRASEIMKKGYEYGQSRVICGVHWQSDVDSGRLAGAVFVSALHSRADFNQDMARARQEFARTL